MRSWGAEEAPGRSRAAVLGFQQGLGGECCSHRGEGRSLVAHKVLSSLLASERLGWRSPLGQETVMLAGLDALPHGTHDIAGCSCWGWGEGEGPWQDLPRLWFPPVTVLGEGVF